MTKLLTNVYFWHIRRIVTKRLAVRYGVTIESAGELYDEFEEFGAELIIWTATSLNVDIEDAKKIVLAGMVRMGDAARNSRMTASQAAEALIATLRSSAVFCD
jgi:menaquinone-dependent protoporphyrinogen IX oxidase